MPLSNLKTNGPTVIIGAGPAGLTAAYELSKSNFSSVVLEADDVVGGISRTVNYDGYRFDIGGHRFFSKIPYVNQLWEEILGNEFLLRPRLSRIHYRGHFFDYPLKATNALAGLGAFEAMMVVLSYFRAKVAPYNGGSEDNFEQWVANRFGYRLYSIFFKTYTEKVWGLPCHQISADWAAQRIKNLSLKNAVYNAIMSGVNINNKEVITSLIEQFHYPKLGPGMMWEKCVEAIGERNNPTIMQQRVTKIRHKNGEVQCVEAVNAAGEKTEYHGPQFISSMPLKELILALDPKPPEFILEAAYGLKYRDYLTVVLVLNREEVFPDNWIYIHTPEVKLGRIQNYKNWSPYMVPDTSKTALGLEYFLWEKDEQWNWSNDRLIDLGIRECTQINLINPGEVTDGTVVKMKKAYPVYDHYYNQTVNTLKEYLGTFKNLQTIGRNGLHRYNNQDHSMMTAVYSVKNMLGENHDVWDVNTEQAYHEESEEKKSGASGERMVPVRLPLEETDPQKAYDAIVEEEFAGQAIKETFSGFNKFTLGLTVGFFTCFACFLLTMMFILDQNTSVALTQQLQQTFGLELTWTEMLLWLGGFLLGAVLLGHGLTAIRKILLTPSPVINKKTSTVESGK